MITSRDKIKETILKIIMNNCDGTFNRLTESSTICIDNPNKLAEQLTTEFSKAIEDINAKAIELAVGYGCIDGAHHKAWVIDQMVRVLAGDRYDDIVRDACDGEEGPDTYEWDCGVAP